MRCGRLVGLVVLLLGSVAQGQTATSTATSTVTATGTVTQTPTPTPNRERVLAFQTTCASPPCNLVPGVPGGHGVTTIAVTTTTGTATVLPICVIGDGYLEADIALGSLSGATCTTTANCLLTTTAACDRIYLSITACGSSCLVNSWVRDNPYMPR